MEGMGSIGRCLKKKGKDLFNLMTDWIKVMREKESQVQDESHFAFD